MHIQKQLPKLFTCIYVMTVSLVVAGCWPAKQSSIPGRYEIKNYNVEYILVLRHNFTYHQEMVFQSGKHFVADGNWLWDSRDRLMLLNAWNPVAPVECEPSEPSKHQDIEFAPVYFWGKLELEQCKGTSLTKVSSDEK